RKKSPSGSPKRTPWPNAARTGIAGAPSDPALEASGGVGDRWARASGGSSRQSVSRKRKDMASGRERRRVDGDGTATTRQTRVREGHPTPRTVGRSSCCAPSPGAIASPRLLKGPTDPPGGCPTGASRTASRGAHSARPWRIDMSLVFATDFSDTASHAATAAALLAARRKLKLWLVHA